ncbi:MAG: hypothetical protein RIQ93_2391 [Verrucomicrobiota bacterium]|jgi:hypothetical protein
MRAVDLKSLHGKTVLVTSALDQSNPPPGRRGWLETRELSNGDVAVSLVLEFPQMFKSVAHRRTIPLAPEDLARLLASENAGAFTFELPD